jgi:hypothetical protein
MGHGAWGMEPGDPSLVTFERPSLPICEIKTKNALKKQETHLFNNNFNVNLYFYTFAQQLLFKQFNKNVPDKRRRIVTVQLVSNVIASVFYCQS